MVKPSRLELTYVSISAISQHPENAHNGDVETIAESMAVNGVYKPIVVQKSTAYILAGNHSYVAMLEQGMTEVPVVFLDVTNAEARRIMLADNRTAALGREDEGLLAGLLESVYRSDQGFLGTGYQMEDLSALLELASTPMAPDEVVLDHTEDEVISRLKSDRLADRPELKYGLNPTTSEDGKAYSITLTKASGKAITAVEANMIRKALGMEPWQQDELDRLGVPAWRRD